MKKCYFILCFLLLLVQESFAQTVDWVNYGGGINSDAITDVAIDVAGNVYVTGQLGNSASFNGTAVSGGIFAAKYDSIGNQQWVIAYGDTNSFGKAICLDKAGNIYVSGWMDSSLQAGDTLLTTLGDRDMLLMKFNPSGNLLWVKQFGGDKSDNAAKIICDENDHLYLSGFFSSTAHIGNFEVNASGDYADLFIARCDTAGNVLWVKTAGGTGEDHADCLATDGIGNIFLTGNYTGTATFGSTTITSNGQDDIFVARYDTAGVFKWVKSAGAANKDQGLGVCASANGNCYVTGNFQNTVYFGTTQLVSSGGSKDLFIACYTPGGTCKWARQATGSGTDRGAQIKMTDKGKIVVGGSFESTITFSGTNLYSGGENDIFIARYDTLGFFETAIKAGGISDDRCFAIVPQKNNRIATGGFFSGSATLGNFLVSSNGGQDALVLKANVSSLYITSISDSSLCKSQSFDVAFIAEGTFLAGNVFTVQLSNSSGDFTTTTSIGTLNSIYSGVVHATIPSSITYSGNYKIRISSSNSQCLGMFNVPIGIYANPTLAVAGSATMCKGDSTTLIATGALTYTWIPSINLSTAGNDSVIAFPNSTTTYNITGTDQYGCFSTVSKTLTVYDGIPFVGISASGATTICAGQTTSLSANNVAGNTYQWQLNGSNIAGAVSYTYTAGLSGNYTCIGTNPCGTSTSNSISITVNPKPVVTIGSFLPVCQSSPPFTLTSGFPLGGSYSGSYITNGVFTPSLSGIYPVAYAYVDSNGCSNSASTLLQVMASPSLTWTNVFTTFCQTAGPVTITGASPEGGVYSGTGVTDGMFYPAVAGPGTHVVTYKYTNASGCSKTITKNFVVSTAPAVSITMDSLICVYVSSFTLTGGAPAGGTYYINGVQGTLFNPGALGAGMQTVSYKVINGACTVYDTTYVMIDICVGIAETFSSAGMLVYPNPSTDLVNITTNIKGENIYLEITDAIGKVRRELSFSNLKEESSMTLDLRDLPPGIYTVILFNDKLRLSKILVLQ